MVCKSFFQCKFVYLSNFQNKIVNCALKTKCTVNLQQRRKVQNMRITTICSRSVRSYLQKKLHHVVTKQSVLNTLNSCYYWTLWHICWCIYEPFVDTPDQQTDMLLLAGDIMYCYSFLLDWKDHLKVFLLPSTHIVELFQRREAGKQ